MKEIDYYSKNSSSHFIKYTYVRLFTDKKHENILNYLNTCHNSKEKNDSFLQTIEDIRRTPIASRPV